MSNAPKCKSPTGQCFARSLGYCTILTCELNSARCAFKKPRRLETGGKVYPNNPAASVPKEVLTRKEK
jgi:hypothetical protein